MERNWYVICTKKKKERKLVSALRKKGIENFCPFTVRETKNVSRSSKEFGPLFLACVFVNVEPTQLNIISKMAYVINPLYWGSSPAIINADEINAIKMMEENYSCITLDKLPVNTTGKVSVAEKNITRITNNTVTVMHQGISIKLPTLGYSITAERSKEKLLPQVVKKQTPLQAVTQRLSALFL